MRHHSWKRGLGIGLIVAAMAGCEDPPLAVLVPAAGTSPTPGTSPSAPATATPTPTPSASRAPGASPTPTPTRTPTPTPTPSSSSDASSQAITNLVFDAPLVTSDFTAASLPVKVRAIAPTGVVLKEFSLYYDNQQIYSQKQSSPTLSMEWNPHVVAQGKDNTAVPFGTHVLTAKATTTAGRERELTFEFDKPLVFKGWVRRDDANVDIPALPQARMGASLYAHEANHQLYALFGRDANGLDLVAIQKLSLDNLGTSLGQWQYCREGGLTPRQWPAVTGNGNHIYIVGGQVAAGPTASVMDYHLNTEAATAAPDLPTPLTDATAAVLGNHLYVFGGTTDGTATGVTNQLLRLELEKDGSPKGTAWQTMSALPVAQGRRGANMIAHRDKLYLFGGRNASDVMLPVVYAYSPANNSWDDVGSLRTGYYHGTAGAIGTQVFLSGGIVDAQGTKSSAVVRYDSETKSVTTMPTDRSLVTPRSGMGAAVVKNKLYLVGGAESAKDANDVPFERPLTDVLKANSL